MTRIIEIGLDNPKMKKELLEAGFIEREDGSFTKPGVETLKPQPIKKIDEIYVVDTETTGLDGFPEDVIVEIAVCKVDTEKKTVDVIYDSIVGHGVKSWDHLRKHAWIFGNSDLALVDVSKATPQKDVVKKVREILKDKYVTSFNTDYDFTRFLCCDPWDLYEVVKDICNCIMLSATPVCGIEGYYGEYKWPRLEEAYAILCKDNPAKVKDQPHRALSDTLMASHVLLSLIDRDAYSLTQNVSSKTDNLTTCQKSEGNT